MSSARPCSFSDNCRVFAFSPGCLNLRWRVLISVSSGGRSRGIPSGGAGGMWVGAGGMSPSAIQPYSINRWRRGPCGAVTLVCSACCAASGPPRRGGNAWFRGLGSRLPGPGHLRGARPTHFRVTGFASKAANVRLGESNCARSSTSVDCYCPRAE